MLAVVIAGPPGAGKTALLTALSDALADDSASLHEPERMAAAMPAIAGIDLVLSSEDASPGALAAQVRAALGR